MNAKMKAKWLKALRSGKYQQGDKALRTKDQRHCCLGVLCDISRLGQWKGAFLGGTQYIVGSETGTGEPPAPVADAAGLKYPNPEIEFGAFLAMSEDFTEAQKRWLSARTAESYVTLAQLNDSGKWNFDQIADVIEAFL